MVVPYGDSNPGWFFRNAFDVGENNMGLYADSLEPLTDAPSNATFINAVLADDKGVPYEIPRAIALYERDGGLLWKHYDDKLKPSRAEPVCQINDHAREKARFSNSEKEAGNIELPGGVHKASQRIIPQEIMIRAIHFLALQRSTMRAPGISNKT
jgi:hypothetical protein